MQDTFYNCLDFCAVYHRTPYFYLTGGDPILHPDFWKLLALSRKRACNRIKPLQPPVRNLFQTDG